MCRECDVSLELSDLNDESTVEQEFKAIDSISSANGAFTCQILFRFPSVIDHSMAGVHVSHRNSTLLCVDHVSVTVR